MSEREILLQECEILLQESVRAGYTPDEVRGRWKHAPLMRVRRIVAYRLRTELGRSYPKIAKALGRYDHTTAMNLFPEHAAKRSRRPRPAAKRRDMAQWLVHRGAGL